MPLQANVEEVPSQDEEEMYEHLLDQKGLKLRLPVEAKRCRFAGGCAGYVA